MVCSMFSKKQKNPKHSSLDIPTREMAEKKGNPDTHTHTHNPSPGKKNPWEIWFSSFKVQAISKDDIISLNTLWYLYVDSWERTSSYFLLLIPFLVIMDLI